MHDDHVVNSHFYRLKGLKQLFGLLIPIQAFATMPPSDPSQAPIGLTRQESMTREGHMSPSLPSEFYVPVAPPSDPDMVSQVAESPLALPPIVWSLPAFSETDQSTGFGEANLEVDEGAEADVESPPRPPRRRNRRGAVGPHHPCAFVGSSLAPLPVLTTTMYVGGLAVPIAPTSPPQVDPSLFTPSFHTPVASRNGGRPRLGTPMPSSRNRRSFHNGFRLDPLSSLPRRHFWPGRGGGGGGRGAAGGGGSFL